MSDITVKDRRHFDKDGNLNAQADDKNTSENDDKLTGEAQEPENPPPKQSPEPDKKAESVDMGGMPVTIGALFLDLTTSAFLQMGEKGQDGKSLPNTPNLPAAKQLIDLLGILEQKTKGNLTSEEEALLKALLYDARVKFVGLNAGKKS
jgi:hypothetical protein